MLGWSHHKSIDVSPTNVDANLTDVPTLVVIGDDPDLSKARTDGFDMEFTLDDGVTVLKYDRRSWNGGGGSAAQGIFWVRIPSINSTLGATIQMHYGNPSAADGQDRASTYDSFYKAVNHLDQGVSTAADFYADATGSGHHGTLTDDTASVTTGGGPAGQTAIVFAGTVTAHITIDNHADLQIGTTDFSVESWVQPHVVDKSTRWIRKASTSKYEIGKSSSGNGVWFWLQNLDGAEISQNGADVTNAWHHSAMALDRDGNVAYYLDGALVAEDDISGSEAVDADCTADLILASFAPGVLPFDGGLADLRISKGIARSTAWYKFQFANTSTVGNELTIGPEVANPTPFFFRSHVLGV